MVLLAIDTSGATTVAVLADDGAVLAAHRDDDPRGHAEHIGPLLERVLADAGEPVIDAVAYGTGPGPFTGLRVGMAAARTAALALAAEELPVPSHDAIALAALLDGREPPFVVVTDAKRRERFFTAYERIDVAGAPASDDGPQVGPESAVPDLPRVERPLEAEHLGRAALRRRAAGFPPAPSEARYLRSPDVTLAAAPKSVLG